FASWVDVDDVHPSGIEIPSAIERELARSDRAAHAVDRRVKSGLELVARLVERRDLHVTHLSLIDELVRVAVRVRRASAERDLRQEAWIVHAWIVRRRAADPDHEGRDVLRALRLRGGDDLWPLLLRVRVRNAVGHEDEHALAPARQLAARGEALDVGVL